MKFRQYLNEIEFDYPQLVTVYHYTSPEGFKSIIEGQSLRFTRCDCLNDYKENENIKELYQPCLEELLLEGKIDQDHYEQYRKIDFKHRTGIKGKDGLSKLSLSTPFVCCFSLEQDSLQMWQYYSKGGNYEGYNIAFDLCRLIQDKELIIKAGKVIYNEGNKKKIIKKAVLQIYEIDRMAESKQRGKAYSTEFISSEMAYIGCFFKSESFSGEKEVRIVIEIPDNIQERTEENKLGLMGKYNIPEIKYSLAHAMMIPYFEMKYQNMGAIRSITIGPITSQRNEAAKKNKEIIDCFLQDKLKRRIDINESCIPVRY